MSPPPRSRVRRDRQGGDPEERLRRTLESQQAAYEASRAVLSVAAARRDAVWRQAAAGNLRRTLKALGAPLLLGALLMALGALWFPLFVAGAALTILWAALAVRIWHRPAAGVLGALGGVSLDDAAARGAISTLEAERLGDVTEGLCAALGLAVPAVRIIDGTVPNAVALGRGPDDATLLLTAALARLLDRIELEAVLAHELAHVKRRDVLTAAVAASGLGRAGDAISRGRFAAWLQGDDREMRADVAAVAATRYPPGLITALERIASANGGRSPTRCLPAGRSGRERGAAHERNGASRVGANSRSALAASTHFGPDDRAVRRVELSWLAPPSFTGRPARRSQSELDDRLDVLREL